MTKEFSPRRLDVKAFAQAEASLSGHESLLNYERLAQEAQGLHPDLLVDWQAHGSLRSAGAGSAHEVWLHLQAQAQFPMHCQRCLGTVDMPLQVAQDFRFVADEATAEVQDEESEEDVLVLSREFDLHALIEDELLMALPMVPMHEQCPQPVVLAVGEAELAQAEADKPNPFAALAQLQLPKDKNSSKND